MVGALAKPSHVTVRSKRTQSLMAGVKLDEIADMSLQEFAASFGGDKLAPLVTRNCNLRGDVDKQNQDFGTLDDVPDFALRDMKALYSLMFQRFEKFDGQVQYGPVTIGVFDDGYWGRQMMLPSQEMFQMRFAPKNLVSNSEQRVVMFATRTVSMTGQSAVSNAVLFCPEIPSESHELAEAVGRPVGCKGLHVMMAAFFKRHNPGIGGPNRLALPTNGVAYDPFGYQAVRATTYSVHKSDRKGLERSADHINACSATSGSSILTIAGELVDTHLTPVVARAATPVPYKKWKQDCADFKAEIMSAARSPQLGNAAILSAATISELLSAEGMVGMGANPFFEGARPDRLFMPHGVPLSVVMAVRLAMHWEHYGLPRPARVDMAANDQLRMLFESTSYGPLPLLEEGTNGSPRTHTSVPLYLSVTVLTLCAFDSFCASIASGREPRHGRPARRPRGSSPVPTPAALLAHARRASRQRGRGASGAERS